MPFAGESGGPGGNARECPVQLRLQDSATNGDRSQRIAMSSEGRSQEDRRWLCSLQRLGGDGVREGITHPSLQRTTREAQVPDDGREPNGS